jgi:hypothetical protein
MLLSKRIFSSFPKVYVLRRTASPYLGVCPRRV